MTPSCLPCRGGGRCGDLPQPWSLHIPQTQTQATVQPCTCSTWSRVNIPVRVALWLLRPMPGTWRLGTVWWASPGVRAGGAAALGLQPGSPSGLAGVGGNAVASPLLAVSCSRPPPACVGGLRAKSEVEGAQGSSLKSNLTPPFSRELDTVLCCKGCGMR